MLTIDVAPMPGTRTKQRDARWRVMFGDEHLGDFRQPFYESARALVALGHDPGQSLQMRHANGVIGLIGRLGKAAEATVSESDTEFKVRKWRSMADSPGTVSSKTGSDAIPGQNDTGEQK